MNAKQKRFADEYLVDCNATQAAIRAGYSEKSAGRNADRMMKNDEIKKYIEEQLEHIHNERTADAQEVIEYLTSVMRGQHKEQILQFVGDGMQKIIDIDVSAKERLRAAELLGKRYGMFTEKITADAKVNVSEKLSDIINQLGADGDENV